MKWLVLGLIGTAAFAQDDRPTRRVDDPELQKAIHRAIDRGVAYLKGMQEPDGSYVTASTTFPMRNRSMDAGYTALCLYAMAVSGVEKDDPVLTRGVAWADANRKRYLRTEYYSTYSVSLLLLALARIDAKEHTDFIGTLAGHLVYGQLPDGTWSYHLDPHKPAGKNKQGSHRSLMMPRDHSNTQFAVTALWAAYSLGKRHVPRSTWTRIVNVYGGDQLKSGGWATSASSDSRRPR